jgi:predicted dehydrogenase
MRVLFCGLGSIGQRHLRNLRRLVGNDLEVHAYRVLRNRHKFMDNLSIDPGADLERDYNITVHSSLDEALAVNPSVVFVCNPSSLHIPIALAAARSGAHIFIEKPVSNSLEGLEELVILTKSKNLVCYVGYNFHFHPGLIRMKGLIDNGFFGNVVGVKAEIGEFLPNWHKYEDYRDTYAAREALGGGVVLSQIHEMDLIVWFFGLPKSIFCLGGKLSNLECDVEDTALSLMQYDGEYGKFPISLHQDFLQRLPVRIFKVIGDIGQAEIDLIKNRMTIYNGCEAVLETLDFPGFERNDMFFEQSKHFLECITKGCKLEVDLDISIKSLRLALAAKKSLAKGAVIQLSGGDS